MEKVRKAVSALPEKYRYPVELYYSADVSLQEIADVLRLPLPTVKTRLRRARLMLKEALEGDFDDG
ncbi:MAG: sigma factor-like helix-turn-helix DNA-binding protein [Lachnospiraceae bacterium]|nr:sigma factor-like helix-turn-helix DNA-binding protein [Lachnospiraceae bacterium]